MKVAKIYYSTHFSRAFKQLPKSIQKKALAQIGRFRENCFDPILRSHKLKGALEKYWSFSITYKIRILFEFMPDNAIGFIDIDDHDIYRR